MAKLNLKQHTRFILFHELFFIIIPLFLFFKPYTDVFCNARGENLSIFESHGNTDSESKRFQSGHGTWYMSVSVLLSNSSAFCISDAK